MSGQRECMFCGSFMGYVEGLPDGAITSGNCKQRPCIEGWNRRYGAVHPLPLEIPGKLPSKPYDAPLLRPGILREISDALSG